MPGSIRKARAGMIRALSVALLLWGCSSKEKETNPGNDDADGDYKGTKDCAGAGCASAEAPTNWAAGKPTFAAHVRVVDALGNPVKGAQVSFGDAGSVKTNDKGLASAGGLDARRPARVKVRSEGNAPYLAETDVAKSGQRTEEIVVTRLAVDKMVDSEKEISISSDKSRVQIHGKSLADSTGRRAKKARAELATLPPKSANGSVFGSRNAVDREGLPATIDDLLNVIYLHFIDAEFGDEKGNPLELNLAHGQLADLSLDLPKGVDAAVGERLSLWSLDEKSNQWREDSSCVVGEITGPAGKQKVCDGVATHFSYWAVGRKIELGKPYSIGCSNLVTSVPKDACFKVEVEGWSAVSCNKTGCELSQDIGGTFAGASGLPMYCSFTKPWPTHRAALIYYVDGSECDGKVATGRRVEIVDFDLTKFKSTQGAELLETFSADRDGTCTDVCEQVTFELTEAGVAEAPIWYDGDSDASYANASGDKKFLPWAGADCDDGDSATHPGASESFCSAKDNDCDGKAGAEGSTPESVGDPITWNLFCSTCNSAKKGRETPGNLYDENCDGVVTDRDGDGTSEPADCNDWDPDAKPKGTEKPGNWVDENCDGIAVDRDGDGVAAPQHLLLAKSLGLSPSKFVDCDDYDDNVHPGADPENEAAALSPFYYVEDKVSHRAEAFCQMFEMGAPNYYYYSVVRDLNCDGRRADADGDGFTAIGDTSLGEEIATDCDDLDPRVGPASEGGACEPISGLANDSECKAVLDGTCPPLTTPGAVLTTVCEEIKVMGTGEGTGEYACSYLGWWDGDPTGQPGEVWGPCDRGMSTMPDCPQGTTCGAPDSGKIAYTAKFAKYLADTYNGGEALGYQGMCFPGCAAP